MTRLLRYRHVTISGNGVLRKGRQPALSRRSRRPPVSFVGLHLRRIARVIVFQLSRLCIAMGQRRAVSVIGPPPMGELPMERSRPCYRPCFTPRDGFENSSFPFAFPSPSEISHFLSFSHIFSGFRNARTSTDRIVCTGCAEN